MSLGLYKYKKEICFSTLVNTVILHNLAGLAETRRASKPSCGGLVEVVALTPLSRKLQLPWQQPPCMALLHLQELVRRIRLGYRT
jgi:hypothetical protein